MHRLSFVSYPLDLMKRTLSQFEYRSRTDKPPESLLDSRIKKQQNKTALAMFTTGFVSQALAGCELLFHV